MYKIEKGLRVFYTASGHFEDSFKLFGHGFFTVCCGCFCIFGKSTEISKCSNKYIFLYCYLCIYKYIYLQIIDWQTRFNASLYFALLAVSYGRDHNHQEHKSEWAKYRQESQYNNWSLARAPHIYICNHQQSMKSQHNRRTLWASAPPLVVYTLVL